jgi:hypothetical protein
MKLFSNRYWKPIQMIHCTDLSMLLLPKVNMSCFRDIFLFSWRIWRFMDKDWLTNNILSQFIEDLIQWVHSITKMLMPETRLEPGQLSNQVLLLRLLLLGSLKVLKGRNLSKINNCLFSKFTSIKIILLQLRLRWLMVCRGIQMKKRFLCFQCLHSRL